MATILEISRTPDVLQELGQRVRQVRLARNETIALVAQRAGVGINTVRRLERGQNSSLESLIQIIQRRKRTILFSSHILGDVERVADRIGILVDGVLRVDCPTDRFKESIRKVVLQFDKEPPEFPSCQGLVSNRTVGSKLELILVGYSDEHRRLAESL